MLASMVVGSLFAVNEGYDHEKTGDDNDFGLAGHGIGECRMGEIGKVTLRNNPANDGDSFHVVHQGREYYFRLYFVDAPETHSKLKDRIADQARAFRIDERTVLKKVKTPRISPKNV